MPIVKLMTINLVLLYLNVVGVAAADLVISPKDPYVTPGSALDIICTCNSAACKSTDIVWTRDFVDIEAKSYNIVNTETTSQISIHDIQLTHQYGCCMADDPQRTACYGPSATNVNVGIPPGPAQNFNCVSRNLDDYWCEWECNNPTMLKMTYVFQYSDDNKTWYNCPKQGLCRPNDCPKQGLCKCLVSSKNHYNAVEQYIKLTSRNAMGSYTDTLTFAFQDITMPNPPSNIRFKTINYDSIVVTWNLPKEWNHDFNATLQYRLRYGLIRRREYTSGIGCENVISSKIETIPFSTTKRKYTLTGLKAFSTYCISMGASVYTGYLDIPKWSSWSDPEESHTSESAPVGRVQNVSIIMEEPTSTYEREVTLAWDNVPIDQQNGIIKGYTLSIKQEEVVIRIQNTTGTTKRYSFTGIKKFQAYVVVIKAFNSVGYGPPMNVDIKDRTNEPEPPDLVQIDSKTNTSMSVRWVIPSEPNGYIKNYTIQWKTVDEDKWLSTFTTSDDRTSYTISGLHVYTLYDLRIRANNHRYKGKWKYPDQPSRTSEGVPTRAPKILSVKTVDEEPTELTVTWMILSVNESHGSISKYRLHYCVYNKSMSHLCTGDTTWKDVIGESEMLRKSETLHNLHTSTSYLVWINAFTRAGAGPLSEKATGKTSDGVPGPPENLSAYNITSNTVRLAWNAPLSTHDIIHHFNIRYELITDNNEYMLGQYLNVTDLYTVVYGLHGYSTYAFSVRACNTKEQCGEYSNAVLKTTDIGYPGPPMFSSVSPISSTEISITWKPPLHRNGPIPYYLVEHRRSSIEPSWHNTTVSSTHVTLEVKCGINEHRFMFDFRVLAVNVDDTKNGRLLQGNASETQQYRMCSPIAGKTRIIN
ncbi:receptor-type tyrosine-protein phosphatase F-like [Amphiura filiformis]|uniref:receptor-type tyrosine-protein phosphatase F-like n=1 Tax=Amphiura filiformis TaxID=82378 RepID=UPI003B226357